MTRSLRTRIARLEEEYRPLVVAEEEIDCHQLVRRLGFIFRLAENGDEEALAWREKLFTNINQATDGTDERDEP